jgi:hypothetical protein
LSSQAARVSSRETPRLYSTDHHLVPVRHRDAAMVGAGSGHSFKHEPFFIPWQRRKIGWPFVLALGFFAAMHILLTPVATFAAFADFAQSFIFCRPRKAYRRWRTLSATAGMIGNEMSDAMLTLSWPRSKPPSWELAAASAIHSSLPCSLSTLSSLPSTIDSATYAAGGREVALDKRGLPLFNAVAF